MADRQKALACGLIAMLVAGSAVIAAISVQSWSLTALVRTARDDPIAPYTRQVDPDFQFVEQGGHYDGSFFYVVALDPLARGPLRDLIDRAAYRYAHPGYGWAAWALSHGDPSLVPVALFVVGLISMGAAATTAALIASHFGWSPWWGGLLVAFSPGLVFAVVADTSEPLGLALAGLLVLAWIHRRWAWAALLSISVCLVKEPLVLVPLGLLLWDLLQARRGHPGPAATARTLALASGVLALGLWLVYLRATFGVWPTTQAADILSLPPVSGWVETFRKAAVMARQGDNTMQVGTAALSLLPALGGAIVVGLVRAVRFRTVLDLLYVLFAFVALSLNWLQLLNPKDLVRVTALTVILLPAVLVQARVTRPEASEPVAEAST